MRLRACILAAVLVLTSLFVFVRRAPAARAADLRPFDPVQRPVEILPETKVDAILTHLPPIEDPALREVLDSPDTVFYDRTGIVPGYQDSYGDERVLPIGFRPNTIDRGLIDLAVPGGHAKLFIRKGEFHFPFGRTGGVDDAANTFVVDFWRLPRVGGKLLPVAYSKWEPNGYTHRWEWVFPTDTVFGEMIFITESDGTSHIFEIRTRRRMATGWTVGVFRPFLTATDFADALEAKRKENPNWVRSPKITALVAQLRDPGSLKTATLSGTHFGGSFAAVNGAVDTLPGVEDPSIFVELLHETPFRSALGSVWKQSGGLTSYAASTQEDFHIVPKNYNAALFQMDDAFCSRCHENAGRPFKDYYPEVQAYGELWGEDDTFSWHPFESKNFVDKKGAVVSFNDDNRRFRQDFVKAGLIAPYNPKIHTVARYQKLSRPWKGYKY